MQSDLFGGQDPGIIRANPCARINSRSSSSGHPGARKDPGSARALPGEMPRRERAQDRADMLGEIQKLKQRIEELGGEVMAQRDATDKATAAAAGPKAEFWTIHETTAEWCQDMGMPPYEGAAVRTEFRRRLAARDQAGRVLAPLKRAESDATRVLKAMVAELKFLNTELERNERLLG